jgi:peptide-methionine (S)-S-oxide reductase
MVAVFGGGCFWCTEAVFSELKGVISVLPGYSGGSIANPTYDQVCSGTSGHAEVLKVEFDPTIISYTDLLTVFFATHDPTTLNRQGADVGTQYRSIIFTTNEDQRQQAEQFIADLNTDDKKIVTELAPLGEFYPAEQWHREYYFKNSDQPYCQLVISPKLEKLKEKYAALLKK